MAATQLGQTINTQPGTSTTISSDGVTHVITREMPATYARREVSQHPGYSLLLTVNDVLVRHTDTSINYEAGDMAMVTYTYKGGGPVEGNNPSSSAETPSGAITNTPGIFYDLDVATESVSILRNDRYRLHISGSDRLILGKMLQMGPLDEDGNALSDDLVGDRAIECGEKIESGITSFESPVYIWRQTIKDGSWETSQPIGKIDPSPPGPVPDIGNGNWLFLGMSAKGGDGVPTEVSLTWKSSIAGSQWDDELYT